MRTARSVVILCISICCTAAPLQAQRLANAQLGIGHPLAALVPLRAVIAPAAEQQGPRRWPYVVGGAVVGGAAAGVLLAREVSRTDDAMVFPVYVVGAVGAGAALGAVGGWIVSTVVRPSAR